MVDTEHLTAGQALLARMRSTPPGDTEAWGKLKAEVADWYGTVRGKITPAQSVRMGSTRAGESAWSNWSDLIHNDRKQLAADLSARLDFLAGEK